MFLEIKHVDGCNIFLYGAQYMLISKICSLPFYGKHCHVKIGTLAMEMK